jgi:hypothetical protein
LKNALPEACIEHPSHWFGPSSLFLELDSERNRTTFHQRMSDCDQHVRSIVEDEDETVAMHKLLNGSDADILSLSEDACVLAIHRFTLRSLQPGMDGVARRIAQKQLATSLLRYSLVRNF